MYKLGQRVRKILNNLPMIFILGAMLFIPVSCTVLTWKGCLEAEGSFFYCAAILSK